MEMRLTPELLQFLVEQGYKWSLSKTDFIDLSEARVKITLTPVIDKPVLSRLPMGWDTYFLNNAEPRIMAKGIDDTDIYVVISNDLIEKYNS